MKSENGIVAPPINPAFKISHVLEMICSVSDCGTTECKYCAYNSTDNYIKFIGHV